MRSSRRTAALLAAALSLFVLVLTLRYGTFVAGGADSYGYVSEAELWEKGRLHVKQPLAAVLPWPNVLDTLCPLGYTPAGRDTIVPTYSPGLPLLMVVFRKVFGRMGQFYVVPVMAALVVWLSFLLGRKLTGRASVGIAAAVVMASSPPFLSIAMAPMSDVPAAATWTLAVWLALSGSPGASLAAGLAASLAVLIRPNLVPIAAVIGASVTWCSFEQRGCTVRSLPAPLLFVCGLIPGVAAVAAINASLYGSPFLSGYGSLRQLYAWANLGPNLRNYGTWLATSGCAYVLLGTAALAFYPRTIAPEHRRSSRFLLAGITTVVWASYLFYLQFDAWWYLRFLLPMFPVAIVLAAAAVAGLFDRLRVGRPALVLVATAAIVFGIGFSMARAHDAFGQSWGESRYVRAGEYVKRYTPAGAVVFAMQESGSLRYYGSRVTIRYDLMDPAWLDRAVEALMARGMHPYIVLEIWEVADFKRRFRAASRLGALDWPAVELFPSGVVRLWDAAPAWFVERKRSKPESPQP
jgi:hypothetical protein